jgi:hypothetical protein
MCAGRLRKKKNSAFKMPPLAYLWPNTLRPKEELMPKANAVVKVILRSKQVITSPTMPRDQAENALQEISKARLQGGDAVLPWLSVLGADVEAVHLEERVAPRMPRSGR